MANESNRETWISSPNPEEQSEPGDSGPQNPSSNPHADAPVYKLIIQMLKELFFTLKWEENNGCGAGSIPTTGTNKKASSASNPKTMATKLMLQELLFWKDATL